MGYALCRPCQIALSCLALVWLTCPALACAKVPPHAPSAVLAQPSGPPATESGESAQPSASAPGPAPACARLELADLHIDLPYQVHYQGRAVALDRDESAVTTASLRQGRARLLILSLFLWSGFRAPRHTLADFHELLATAERIIAQNPALFDRKQAGAEAISYLFSVESSHALAGQEHIIPGLVARGVRVFGITHALHNQLGDSATDRRKPHGGLTPEGRRLVRAVYLAGGLIDVSHASDATFADIAAIARELAKPLIATHSNARAMTAHPRNLTDEQLREIAASGGLVGVDFHSQHLRDDRAQATIEDVVRHIEHMVAVMGAEHVAIGSDLDGGIQAAGGLDTHAGASALFCTLVRSGMSLGTVRAIAGANALRVLGPYLVQP